MSSVLRRDTMAPGPLVHGPPTNIMTLAPRRGRARSRSDVATEKAQPVHRATRLSLATGQGSFLRSSRIDSSVMLHSLTGRRKRRRTCCPGVSGIWFPFICCCWCIMPGWPGGGGGAPPLAPFWGFPCVDPPHPRSCPTFAGAYSLLPRRTYAFGMPSKPSSWTCTLVPNVIRPTRLSSGKRFRICWIESASSFSSSACAHVSMQNTNAGGPAGGTDGSSYSHVANCGINSAGRFCSEIFSA
mmetsp:Transcript_22693/g.50469  ORF Transcript_22693/g.50469 Transcript_22693/m.50469 type:complete len:242 (+) Transcript_22693:1540-2265(+)